MLSLSWGTHDLQSSLRHMGSSAVVRELWFPDQGSNPDPLQWECGVLATGPPGGPSFSVKLCSGCKSWSSAFLGCSIFVCGMLKFSTRLSGLALPLDVDMFLDKHTLTHTHSHTHTHTHTLTRPFSLPFIARLAFKSYLVA